MTVDTFTISQVAQLTGVNPRTLQYWDQSGFLSPSVAAAGGRRARRGYRFEDVIRLKRCLTGFPVAAASWFEPCAR